MLFEAVIFDLDGTLADTFPLIVAAWNAALGETLGREYSTDEVVARFGIPDAAMLRRELNDHPEPLIEAALEKYFSHYEQAHDMVQAFEGVPQMLHTLHERGVPLGIMTGKGRRPADISLRLLRWEEYFGSVVSGEDVEQQKPAPDGVLRAAHELGVSPSRCAYIGDSPVDIGAGRAAGMFTIAAAWQTFYTERLRAAQPDAWAESPARLLEILDSASPA
ncbi:MAG: hypothetical protein JWN98_2032 [Abditibacteriota bacterium]|nr:hypothetical protein [Abditibacteriota bacterium]